MWRQPVDPSEASSAEIREHVLARMLEWRAQIPDDSEAFLGTYGSGMADKAVRYVGVLLHRAVTTLLPDADLGAKPTFGRYVSTIEQFGRDMRPTCLGLPRRLVTAAEIETLKQLSRTRARMAHVEEVPVADAAAIGFLRPPELRDVLDLVEHAVRMPIFDELICVEGQVHGDPTTEVPPVTTLVINADASYCLACGRGADPTEKRHLTVLTGEEPSPPGCGAAFTETATDAFVTPRFAAGILELRPDLPFAGRRGIEGRA